jgi:N-acetyl-S-(2-succino)cysteine monooxygenase
MSKREGMLRLGATLSATGSHIGAWRHPDAQADGGFNVRRYHEAARIAEAAKFDMIFLADNLALKKAPMEALSRSAHFTAFLEPLTVLTSIAEHTSHIGLVATVSTTYAEPFHVARQFASLDHISGGRAGWNLVTSTQELEARNFSRPAHLKHADRYARAGEFIDVVMGLWNSWEDDALLIDKQGGRFFDPQKLHHLNHEGEHFQVLGPLTVPRAPQGFPVIFQAGSSEPGMDLAARTADCIFTSQPTIPQAIAFYENVKGRLAAYGRDQDDLKVMPGLFPIVGETEAEAQAKFKAVHDLVDPVVGVELLSNVLGGAVDLSKYPVDGPVPEIPETEGNKTLQSKLLDQARRENLTIRDLYLRYAGGYGQRQVIGTPRQIADIMEEAFEAGAVDGYNIASAMLPGSLRDFATMVVPELQRRGLFRTEYEGANLRENLGLKRPAHPAACGGAARVD